MYLINSKSDYVKEIQRYISYAYKFVPQTGVYDDKTKILVKEFQHENNLDETGIVDYQTFTSLFVKYIRKKRLKKSDDISFSPVKFPINIGESSNEIYQINLLLNRLLSYYRIDHSLPLSSFYSVKTADAVKYLRKIYLLEEKDYIDEELYFRLINDYNSILKTEYNLQFWE